MCPMASTVSTLLVGSRLIVNGIVTCILCSSLKLFVGVPNTSIKDVDIYILAIALWDVLSIKCVVVLV